MGEAQGRAGSDAVDPAGDAEQVGGGSEAHAHRLPHVLLHAAIDIVIAGNDEEAVAGEEDEVEPSLFGEQRLQIAKPRVAQDTPPAPRLFLLGTIGVEIG